MYKNNRNMKNNNTFKLANIIRTFFVPKEMINLTKVPSFLGFVLVILSALLCVFSSRLSSGTVSEKQLAMPSLVSELPSDFTLTNQDGEAFPIIEYSKSDLTVIITTTKDGVYTNTYTQDEQSLEITFVIQSSLEEFTSLDQITCFDINGYLSQINYLDNNHQYMLYIMTKDYLYYAYDFSVVMDTTYYLPNDESELVVNSLNMFDTSLWTKEVEVNDQIDFSLTKEENKKLVDLIKPCYKISNDVNTIFSGTNFPNLILINYGLTSTNQNMTFVEFHQELKDAFIETFKARYNVLNFLMALAMVLIFPPIIAGITWLISKQYNLKKYKDYYMICSVCFFDISILSMFLGFFIQYSVIAFIYLTITSIFYIVCIVILNKDQMKFNPKDDFQNLKKRPVVVDKESDYTEIG